jgi:hypothetical protein
MVERFEKFSVCPPPMQETAEPRGEAGERIEREYDSEPIFARGFGGGYVGSLPNNENAARMEGKWHVPQWHLRKVFWRWFLEDMGAWG